MRPYKRPRKELDVLKFCLNVFNQGKKYTLKGVLQNKRYFSIRIILCFSMLMFINGTFADNSLKSKNPCKEIELLKFNSSNNDQCIVWSDSVIPELCSAGQQSRLRILKHTFLFHELEPLSLYDIFSVGSKNDDSLQLQEAQDGADCILGTITRCTTCFKKISTTIRSLNEAYRSFDVTLSRFDCLPAVDTASATRPFSPNATCHNCQVWYRRWLLVHTLKIWHYTPCVNWCFYTQLACPHLAPAKLWDYAGHPSFQCRDMDIDSWQHECDCIHPCDVKGIVAPGMIGHAPSVQHDFFASQVHCETRKRECKKKSKQNAKTRRNGNTIGEAAIRMKYLRSTAHEKTVKTLLIFLVMHCI